MEGEGGARCDAEGLADRVLLGELGRCKDEFDGRFSWDAWSDDSSVPAEEGFESLDTTRLIVASDGLRNDDTFSVEGARRSSFGCPVGVAARLLAAEFADRVVVGVIDRVMEVRVADRKELVNVAARDSAPTEGDLVLVEGGVFAVVEVGVTGVPE